MVGRVVLVAALAALASAPAQAATRLRSFGSCAQLVRYATRHTQAAAGPVATTVRPLDTAAGAGQAPQAAPGAGEALPEDASGTNVQEAGVDEPDVLKSDGRRLFVVDGATLHAIDARAATPRIAGSLTLPEGSGHELLLSGDRVLVISHGPFGVMPLPRPVAPDEPQVAVDLLPPRPPTTVLTEVDVSDPAAMRVVRTMTFDGSPVSARLTGRTARVVVSSTPIVYAQPLLRRSVDGWVPKATLTARGGATHTARLVPCRAIRRPATFSGSGLLTVLTVDLDKGLPAVDSDAVMTDAETVYASRTALYVATQRWDAGPASSTTIHQFDASQPTRTEYRASGTVPGHLLNQFSLSEQDGILRAATTTEGGVVVAPAAPAGSVTPVPPPAPVPPSQGESVVTTLQARDGRLAQLGQVGGLGRGERIYAVRFLGDVGYVVTFRQTDPLYTLDLSKPEAPRIAGELKLPGYSSYLQPVGDGLLLGVGQDATPDGRVTGAQVSLFDVSDPAKPVRLAQRSLGQGAWSEAEQDHHALLWWPATKLALLPVSSTAFTGALGLRVDRGIDEVGRVSHDGAQVRRAAVVGDRLFTLAEGGVQASALRTLAEQAWLPLPAARAG